MPYSYRLEIDKYPHFDFRITTSTPLLVGESIMLFPRNCRLLCRVVSVCKYFSQAFEDDQPIINREVEEKGNVYTTYKLLDDSGEMNAELRLERVLSLSDGENVTDIIPDFENGWANES